MTFLVILFRFLNLLIKLTIITIIKFDFEKFIKLSNQFIFENSLN